jgi:hypothetical protein
MLIIRSIRRLSDIYGIDIVREKLKGFEETDGFLS